jgi:hypothetical protein
MGTYRIIGTERPYSVGEYKGGVLYDNLDTFSEAWIICKLLNEGKGPEWDAIESEFMRLRGTLAPR